VRSTTDLQGKRALRALRKTPETAVCNHLATQIRASGRERMGLTGIGWDERAG